MATKQLKRTPNKSQQKPISLNTEESGMFKCSCCGKEYISQTNNFYASESFLYAGNNHRMTICKKCVDNMIISYTKEFKGDTACAIERICQITDTYFSKKQWELIENSDRNKRFGEYLKTMNLYGMKNSYTNTFLEGIAEKERLLEELPPIKEPEPVVSNIPIKTKRLFGIGFKDEEYESLQLEYDNWIEKYGEPLGKKQQELYVTLCYLKLQMQRSVQHRETNTSTISNSYKSVLDAATTEIEDRKKKEEAQVVLSPLGVLFQDIEKYTPAEYFKDKKLYEDSDHLKEYAQRYIFRPLKNLLTGSKDMDKEFNLSGSEE